MFKWLAKKGIDRSEQEIQQFIDQIQALSDYEIPHLMSRVSLLHAAINKQDFEFGMSINSAIGERQKEISSQIIQLNNLMNSLHKAGQSEMVAAAKVWNITLRCMSDNSFIHYGKKVWAILSPAGREEEIIAFIDETGNPHAESAKALAGYIPPQFLA
jgi:predicted ATPase with chaperone activity